MKWPWVSRYAHELLVAEHQRVVRQNERLEALLLRREGAPDLAKAAANLPMPAGPPRRFIWLASRFESSGEELVNSARRRVAAGVLSWEEATTTLEAYLDQVRAQNGVGPIAPEIPADYR